MTQKQITKQIESATKRVEKLQHNVGMYTTRRDNAIAKAIKKGYDISLDSFKVVETFVPTTRDGKRGFIRREVKPIVTLPYELSDPITNNWERILENHHKSERELRDIENLKEQLTKMDTEENHVTDLVSVISEAMSDFKVEWFDKMTRWYELHYRNIQVILPEKTVRYKRIKDITKRMEEQYHLWSPYRLERFIHKELFRKLTMKGLALEGIVFDKAATMNESEYKAWALEQINREWDSNMRTLVSKLERFNINLEAVKIDGIDTTPKGFECYITDGQERTIYARMIWAAEYSMLVAPHTRYIITERH